MTGQEFVDLFNTDRVQGGYPVALKPDFWLEFRVSESDAGMADMAHSKVHRGSHTVDDAYEGSEYLEFFSFQKNQGIHCWHWFDF